MTRYKFESEWAPEALDDDSRIVEAKSYAVEISSDRAETIHTSPTSVRYTPEANAAKRVNVDVPPDERLQGTNYLEGDLKLIIDSRFELEFDIRKIDTSQENGDDYSIRAFSKGQRLLQVDTEDRVVNRPVYDYLAELVDVFNTIPNDHDIMRDTDGEVLDGISKLGGGTRTAISNSGTVTYSDVGQNASDIDVFYIKAFTPGTSTIEARIISNQNSYSETFSNIDANTYGEWVELRPGNVFDGDSTSYDIEFYLTLDTILHYWTAVEDEGLSREVVTPNVETVSENNQFYNFSEQDLIDNIEESGDGLIVDDDSNTVRTRHVAEWDTDNTPTNEGNPEFIGGEATVRTPEHDGQTFGYDWDFNLEDPFDEWDIYFRMSPIEWFVYRGSQHKDFNYDASWDEDDTTFVSSPVYTGDEAVRIDDSTYRNCLWTHDRSETFQEMTIEGRVYLDGNRAEIGLEAGPFTDSDHTDGYGLNIQDNNLELRRYDSGTPTTLDEDTNVNVSNTEWVYFDLTISDGDTVSGEITGSGSTWTVSSNDSTYTEFGRFFARGNTGYYLDDLFGFPENAEDFMKTYNYSGTVNGTSFGGANGVGNFIGVEYRDWGWRGLVDYDYVAGFNDTEEGNVEVTITFEHAEPIGVAISGVVIVHKESKWDYREDFDTYVHEPEGHLDYPYKYAQSDSFSTDIEFNHVESQENISSSTTDATISNVDGAIEPWGMQQTIDILEPFGDTFSSSSTVSDDFPFPGVSHKARARLAPSGSERNNATPRYGYNRMDISEINVTVDTNNLPVLFDRQTSGNNLSTMSRIADDMNAIFRWEGGHAKIFQFGSLKTSPDLKKEEVFSSVSTEEVYSTAETIGLHNIRSGVLESRNAPEWLDKHKVIRDDSIETTEDAVSRTRSFLRKHGDIDFSGKITTLPTFAPVGEMIDGSMFEHGQDMIIESVRYSKNRTVIRLGFQKSVGSEIVNLETGQKKSKGRQTSRGMRVPVGEDNV